MYQKKQQNKNKTSKQTTTRNIAKTFVLRNVSKTPPKQQNINQNTET